MNSQLKNSRQYLQMAIETALEIDDNLNWDDFVVYLGQILIFTKTYEDHFDTLSRILRCLDECNLKVGIEESCFLMKEVEYLGIVVDRDGLSLTDNTKEKISSFPQPRTASELRSFLSLVGYYKNYCHDIDYYDTVTKQLRERLNSNCFYFDFFDVRAFNSVKNLFL